jgi:hypothetical protein
MPIEPVRNIVQIEKDLIADPDYRHVMFVRPKLNSANVEAHGFRERAQSDEPFSCDLDNIFHCCIMDLHHNCYLCRLLPIINIYGDAKKMLRSQL